MDGSVCLVGYFSLLFVVHMRHVLICWRILVHEDGGLLEYVARQEDWQNKEREKMPFDWTI